MKEKYCVGHFVKGFVCFFYPQGAIIQANGFKGIYKGNKEKNILEKVCLRVISYDEENMWLILDE